MQMDWPFFAITEEPLKSDCVVLRLTLWALMKKLGDQKSQWGRIKTEQMSLCLSSLWFAPNQVKLIHNHLRSESQPRHLGDFFWGWKSWSQRTGAIYLFFFFLSCREANGDSLLYQTNLGPACAANAVCRAPANKNDRLGLECTIPFLSSVPSSYTICSCLSLFLPSPLGPLYPRQIFQ